MVDQEPHDEPTRADIPVVDDPTMAMPATGSPPPPVDPPPTDEPPAPPPDRRPWILAGLLALIAVVAIAALLLGGDDDDETVTVDSTTTSVEETTTTTEATTTTAPTTSTTAPTTTTTSPPTTIDPVRCTSSAPEDPAPTAIVFYDAYTVGDRPCASNVGTASAVDALFAIPGGGGGWTFQGCFEEEVPDPHFLCSYTFEGGSTSFRLNFSDFEGWTVYEVFQTAD